LAEVQLTPGQIIAVVGLSDKPDRPSFDVAHAMQRASFRIVPVNPHYAGQTILGETCVDKLEAIDQHVDIVNCFRKSEEMLEVAEQVVAMKSKPTLVWMQVGIANSEARTLLERNGIDVIENTCIKIHFYNQPR
jgi:uncharacterized protein